jgi:hypothetical protein
MVKRITKESYWHAVDMDNSQSQGPLKAKPRPQLTTLTKPLLALRSSSFQYEAAMPQYDMYFQLQPHHTPQQDAHSEECPEPFQAHVPSSRQVLGLSHPLLEHYLQTEHNCCLPSTSPFTVQ